MRQKSLCLLCGIPGSGKTTWVKQQINKHGGIWLSRDEVRFSLLTDEDDYFSKEDEVFNAFISKIQEALENDLGEDTIYVDATHLNEKGRNKVLNRLDLRRVTSLNAYWFDVPLKVCIQRNALRTGRARVPNDAIRRMFFSAKKPDGKEKYQYTVHTVNEKGEVM